MLAETMPKPALFGPTAEIKGNFDLFSDQTPDMSRISPGFYYKSH